MAMKNVPSYGLFACRKDAELHALCSMGRAYFSTSRDRSYRLSIGSLYRSLRAHIMPLLCAERDAEPPSP